MFNNSKIPKKITKEDEFQNIYDRTQKWKDDFETYFNKKYAHTKPKEHKQKEKSVTIKIYSNLSPYELLRYYNINNKRECGC